MDNKLKFVERLLRFDRSAFADIEAMGNSDPTGACELMWSFVVQVAELHSHVPSGFVDCAFLIMFNLNGRSNTEKLIMHSWDKLGDETRGEVLYSGIANPEVFTNQFCVALYGLSKNVEDRRVIACSLYSTASERGLSINVLVDLIKRIGRYGDKKRDDELNGVTEKMLDNLPTSE